MTTRSQVLQLHAPGKASREIATALNVSYDTVRSHLSSAGLSANGRNLSAEVRELAEQGIPDYEIAYRLKAPTAAVARAYSRWQKSKK